MPYRIRFQPKKTGVQIHNQTYAWVRDLFQQFVIFEDKGTKETGTLDELIGKIQHFGGSIVSASNLRTIVAPDNETKARQRLILSELERLPMHRAAHGFVRGRDAMSCASAHLIYWGKTPHGLVVLNMDASNFFHSVTSPHVRRALEGHGIKPKVVTEILKHCTAKADSEMALAIIDGIHEMYRRQRNEVPIPDRTIAITKKLVSEGVVAKRLAFLVCKVFLSLGQAVTSANTFLPQGAPTSPFLSNITMKLADIRLSAMAKAFGGFYTRYADDFTVSFQVPTKGKNIDGMYRCTINVLKDYGVLLNPSKKRVMGTSKPQDVVGYRINAGRPTVSRQLRRRLRAALHNELVRGSKKLREGKRPKRPGEDYRRETPTVSRVQHLQGLVSYVSTAHPSEASKYRSAIQHIQQPQGRMLNDETQHDTIELTIAHDLQRDFGDEPDHSEGFEGRRPDLGPSPIL